jgi:hypothetical protein
MTETPAPGSTRFRPSILWAVVMLLVPMAIVMTGAVLVLNLIFGTSYAPDWELVFPVLGGTVGGSRVAGTRNDGAG